MSENALAQVIYELNRQFEKQVLQEATTLIESQKNPIIAQLNAAEAEREGLYRQINALKTAESMISQLSSNYLAYRKKEISKEEYQGLNSAIKHEWRDYIGDQLAESVLDNSGTSQQFIQLIRSLGFFGDDQSGDSVDANLLKEDRRVIEYIDSVSASLINLGVTIEHFDQSSIETTDWNALIHSLAVLYEATTYALSVVHESHRDNDEPLTEEEKLIETLSKGLRSDLQDFFRIYSHQQCVFPSGLSTVMMRLRINKRIATAKTELHDFEPAYNDLVSKARKDGYRRDFDTNLYHHVANASVQAES